MKFPTSGGSYARDNGKLTRLEEPTAPAPPPGSEPDRATEAIGEAETAAPAKPKGAK